MATASPHNPCCCWAPSIGSLQVTGMLLHGQIKATFVGYFCFGSTFESLSPSVSWPQPKAALQACCSLTCGKRDTVLFFDCNSFFLCKCYLEILFQFLKLQALYKVIQLPILSVFCTDQWDLPPKNHLCPITPSSSSCTFYWPVEKTDFSGVQVWKPPLLLDQRKEIKMGVVLLLQ